MDTTPLTTAVPVRSTARDLSMTIRRWTRDVAHLRARAVRLKRPVGVQATPVDVALEEAMALCTQLLQDLAGAEMEIQKAAAEARRDKQQADYLFDRMVTPCLCTDGHGRITRANRAAALLLNVSARHLVDQPMLHFTRDREGFLDLLGRLRRDRRQFQCALAVRPRERSTIAMLASVMPQTPDDASEWMWFLVPDRSVEVRLSPRRRLTAGPGAIAQADVAVSQVSS
jgi:PAS domain-containing protein